VARDRAAGAKEPARYHADFLGQLEIQLKIEMEKK
jgi:hypothetical protein